MKHRIRIRRRDGIRQRYWVGKQINKNFGGGPLFRKLIGEKNIILGKTKQERRTLSRQFEKNPELIKDITPEYGYASTIIVDDFPTRPTAVGVYDPYTSDISIRRDIPFKPIGKDYPLERVLRHEIQHRKQYTKKYDINKPIPVKPFAIEAQELPYDMERIEELKMKATILPHLIGKDPILFHTKEGPYFISSILTDPSLLKNNQKLQRVLEEIEAREAEFKLPERKTKPREEEIAKSFREVFRNGT